MPDSRARAIERGVRVRRSDERGRASLGWLESRHTFSFGSYFDPEFMGFGPLRVINEDRVKPNQGFGTHSHKDMEIITYVLDGALEHQDSLGTGAVIRPGEVQRMSAGAGISHSEFNHSSEHPVHFLQIWIVPATTGLEPSYEQKSFPAHERQDRWRLVGSPDGAEGSVVIQQDVLFHAALLAGGQSLSHMIPNGRRAWLQVAQGTVIWEDLMLAAGDGAAFELAGEVRLRAESSAELLLFDLP